MSALEKLLKVSGIDPAQSIGKIGELLTSADARLATIQAHVETLADVAACLRALIDHSQAHAVRLDGLLGRMDHTLGEVESLKASVEALRLEAGASAPRPDPTT